MGIPHRNLRTRSIYGIIKNMKSFATIMTLAVLLSCLFSCGEGKSGPFTFTNNTGETVYVLIDQDGVLEKTFTSGEKYTGKDYYTPTITFVKGLDTAENKKIIANKYTATTTKGFDYEFVKNKGQPLVISANLGGDYGTNDATRDNCLLKEANGKLGDYSDETVSLSDIQTPPDPVKTYQLYTSAPEFRIYNGSGQDVTDLFTISLGKETEPTLQWNLVISYPKVEPVEY